ncbi:MAG: DMT family transporter [Pseudomonadota bacterium]
MQNKSDYPVAILWVLSSTAMWTVIFAAAKFADGAAGTFQILLLRYLGSVITLVLIAYANGGLMQYRSDRPLSHFARAAFGCFAAAAITWASAHMPIADATAIGMLYGPLTVILGIVFLKEMVTGNHWVAVFVSIIGAVIVMYSRGAFQDGVYFWPAMAAALSAVLLSLEGLLIRIISLAENPLGIMLYVSFFGMCLMAIPAFLEWQTLSWGIMLGCLALGPFGILAQYTTIRGYRMAPLSVVGPVDYSWLVFAALLGYFAFNEVPGSPILIGGALILTGGAMLARLRPLKEDTN